MVLARFLLNLRAGKLYIRGIAGGRSARPYGERRTASHYSDLCFQEIYLELLED
jgi:hypothetical protein